MGSIERPDIVLFIADDFSACDWENSDLRTPNLDRVASEGMRFDRAFCASPTCTPSRSAMYTALYPFRNGSHANHSLINDGTKTLPVYLKEQGYRVVLAGKSHIGPRELFPFEYLPHSNVMPPGRHHILYTDLNTIAVDELLRQHDRKQPICIVIGAHSPHVYWMENNGYDAAKLHLPPWIVDTPETRAARCRYFSDVSWLDRQVGDVLGSLARHGYADNTLFMFTADHGAQWPSAKWSLYEPGVRVPLVIRWPGVVKAGALSQTLVSLVDLLPTILEAAGAATPHDFDGQSLLPVLRDPSSKPREMIFATHTGDKEMNRAPMRCVRTAKYKYIHNLAPQIPYTTHISEGIDLDGKDYWISWQAKAQTDANARKLVERYRHHPPEELYDLERDPAELTNLAANADHSQVIADLRQQLKQWRIEQGDDPNKVPMPEDGRLGQIRYAG